MKLRPIQNAESHVHITPELLVDITSVRPVSEMVALFYEEPILCIEMG